MCNRLPQGFRVDVVGEPAPSVDLDDRDPLPILGLELGVAVDRNLPQLEAEFVMRSTDNAACRLAQVAAGRGVEDDIGYG